MDEIGGAMQSGMGIFPLTWQEISAWITLSDLSLDHWELAIIKQLSSAYTEELSQGTIARRPAPYSPVEKIDTDLDVKLVSALRSLKNFKKN